MENTRELTDSEEAKLQSIERRLRRIDKEIHAMGLNIIQHGGNFSVIDGEPWDKKGNRIHGCELYDISDLKCGWDTIDW